MNMISGERILRFLESWTEVGTGKTKNRNFTEESAFFVSDFGGQISAQFPQGPAELDASPVLNSFLNSSPVCTVTLLDVCGAFRRCQGQG